MGIQTTLDAVTTAPRIIDAMRLADDLAFEARRDPGVRTIRILARTIAGTDELTVIAAVHALAGVFDEEASQMLSRLLADDRAFVREHAAWALGQTLPRFDAVAPLLSLVTTGGFTGMLAQSTLEDWSGSIGDTLAVAIEAAMIGVSDPAARTRLVETLGLVRQPIAEPCLLAFALDDREHEDVRVAAVAALGQRSGSVRVAERLATLVEGHGRIAEVARLAIIDLNVVPQPRRDGEGGLTVAQLFLHADIDPSLSSAGAGDNGGIATLLVRLGDALVADDTAADDTVGDNTTAVERVLTLSRGGVPRAAADLLSIGGGIGHVYGHVPLSPEPVPSAAAWPLRVTARRGIRRLLRAAGRVDVLHLRMADVGSLAAVDVAREMGIPVVFTVAPDPHSIIQSLDRTGDLTREAFGATDLREHFWFRTRLVQNLAANAAHTVLFPRPELERDMRELVGIDIASHPERHTIVAEGVDLGVVDRSVTAASAFATGDAGTAGFEELMAMLEELPEHRRGLPIIATVGRLHRVKGMATLVEVWADSGLSERANLLILGGDLATPSLDEREQLARIDAAVPPAERASRGLLMAGHRPNDVAARWLAAVRVGIPGWVAPHGVYVCASLKEEFGIALLEAMATGLLVVAPDAGGPATYVEDGVTGVLTATWDPASLTSATDRALSLADFNADERSQRSHDMVEARFTIQGMAAALGPVYRAVAASEAELLRATGALA
ncbi:glycosyltransferase [Microbacterium sp. P05]|uniref:glycosyltransferase n=1 Tax=Microbacterium sp. P05 TaxID=3366948 RepID=UPI003747421E